MAKMTVEEFVENRLGLKIHVVSDRGFLRCCCPYHSETRPSFGVQIIHPFMMKCFGCGVNGTLIDLAAHILKVRREKAKDIIHDCIDIELTMRERGEKAVQYVPEAVQDMFESSFFGSLAEKYTKYRKIPKWAAKMWRLGFDELNTALVIPMTDVSNGKIRGHMQVQIQGTFEEVFKAKVCEDSGETVTVPGDHAAYTDCVVVEGYVDAIMTAQALWSRGIMAMPVALNTAFPSKSQMSYIRKFRKVYLGFDHDDAGTKAKDYCRKQLKDKAHLYEFAYPESCKDPGEIKLGDTISTKLMVR